MTPQALKGKVIIVTGGASALGREVTKGFLQAGSKPAIPCFVEEEIDFLKQDIGSLIADVGLSKVDALRWSQMKEFASSVHKKEGKIERHW